MQIPCIWCTPNSQALIYGIIEQTPQTPPNMYAMFAMQAIARTRKQLDLHLCTMHGENGGPVQIDTMNHME